MPNRPLAPCSAPGCPNRASPGGYGRCLDHAKAYQRELRDRYPDTRPSSDERGYGADWQRVRAQQLAKYPSCADCHDEGKHTKATDVHHIVALARGGSFADPSNLRSLCHVHHSRTTARQDGGGWRSGKHSVGKQTGQG